MCAKPLFQSNTTARNILVTDYKVRYFPARSRFTHSLCSLYNSDWSQLRLPELMFVDPVRMKSSPGSGGVRNVVPVAIVSYIASDRNPLRYLYVPPLLLDGIYAYFSFIVFYQQSINIILSGEKKKNYTVLKRLPVYCVISNLLSGWKYHLVQVEWKHFAVLQCMWVQNIILNILPSYHLLHNAHNLKQENIDSLLLYVFLPRSTNIPSWTRL